MAETVVEILAKFRAETAEFNRKLTEVQGELSKMRDGVTQSASDMSNSFGVFESAANKAAVAAGTFAAVAGGALIAMGVQSFNAASRVDELDVALQAVGWSTGKGYEALQDAALAVKAMGIEMEIAQKSVLKYAQNNLDLASASKVARVAQDLAVIGGVNSSDAYDRLTHAIITGRSEVLKSVGIQKSAGQAYADYAREIGKTTKQLTYQEKQAAVLNLVLKEGERVAGTYEAAMTSPGKVLRSFARITNELQVAMGSALIKAFGPMILQTYELYKNLVKLVSEGGRFYPVIQTIGAVLTNLATPLTNALQKAVEFTKGLNGVAKSADEAKTRAEGLVPFMERLGTEMQRFLPVLAAVSAALATFGGQNLLKQVPILGSFLGAFNPFLVGLTVLIALSPKLRTAFMDLLESLKPLIPVFLTVGAVIVDVLNIALNYAAVAITALSKAITFSIEFVKRYATVFKILAGVFGIVTVAIMAYLLQVKILNAYTAITNFLFNKKTGVLARLTLAWKKLNLVMKMNPVGLIIAGVTALIAGFVILWNNSEAFRKIIIAVGKAGVTGIGALIQVIGQLAVGLIKINTGPLRLLLKGLDLLGVDAAGKALRGMDNMTENVGKFFQDAGEKVKGFADKLDGLEKKRFKLPKFDSEFKMPKFDEKGLFKGLGKFGGEDEEGVNATGLTDAAIKAQDALRSVVQKYNDFINNDFMPGFTKGGEAARDTIIKGLDMLKNVFDEKGKGLKGAALKSLQDRFYAINEQVRSFIPQAMEIADAFKEVTDALEKAQDELEAAIKDRNEASAQIGLLFAMPFGEPSRIQRAMGATTATVDSIISQYDEIIALVEKRFIGIDPKKKDSLVEYLKNQTQGLVDLANERAKLVDNLVELRRKQEDALQMRATGADSLLEMFSSTFGRPSEWNNALIGAEATVDSIASLYDRLVTAVNNRYAGFDEASRNTMLEYIKKETQAIYALAIERESAVRVLEQAQNSLQDILEEQKSFESALQGRIKGFFGAITDLTDKDSEAVIRVIKTANGLVITQVKESGSGIDKLMKQMQERLTSIRNFARNAEALLAKGLNPEYIRELLEAGPEAAASTLEALAGASGSQISAINSMFQEVRSISGGLSSRFGTAFYGSGVAAAQGIVTGAKSQLQFLDNQMKQIADGMAEVLKPLLNKNFKDLGTDAIAALVKADEDRLKNIDDQMAIFVAAIDTALTPLRTLGADVGDDLIQGTIDALKKKQLELANLMATIAASISGPMAQAAGSIGMVIAQLAALDAAKKLYAESSFTDTGVVTPTPTFTPDSKKDVDNSINISGDVVLKLNEPVSGVDLNAVDQFVDKFWLSVNARNR